MVRISRIHAVAISENIDQKNFVFRSFHIFVFLSQCKSTNFLDILKCMNIVIYGGRGRGGGKKAPLPVFSL